LRRSDFSIKSVVGFFLDLLTFNFFRPGKALFVLLIVLVLAGIKLIFFIVACMVLCFSVVTETAMVTHPWFSYCSAVFAQRQGLSAPHTTYQRVGWECTRTWEGTQLRQLTPANQRSIPYHITSCSTIKAEGRRRKGGMFRVMAFVFLSNHYT